MKEHLLTALFIASVVVTYVYISLKNRNEGFVDGVDFMKHELVIKGWAEYYRDNPEDDDGWRMKDIKVKQ